MTLLLSEQQRRALVSLRTVFGDRRCILIGATALASHVPLTRTTQDVDLAVVVSVPELPPLLESASWRRDRKIQHRWHSPDDAAADILPATEDLILQGELRFDGDAVKMSLVGFDLVLSHTINKLVPGTTTEIEVANLPVLAVLKMVAWLDRPAERARDLGDIVAILEHALADEDERRWDEVHPVGASSLDHEDQAAFFIGLEVARITKAAHRARIHRFLDTVADPDSAWFAQMLAEARYPGGRGEHRLARRLAVFRRGLEHT